MRSLLSQQRDDLRPEDIRYIENKIIEKDLMRIRNNNINEIKYIKIELHIIDEDKLINAIIN